MTGRGVLTFLLTNFLIHFLVIQTAQQNAKAIDNNNELYFCSLFFYHLLNKVKNISWGQNSKK